METLMTVRLGLMHKYRNSDSKIVKEDWDGFYTAVNVPEDKVDWHWIEDIFEQYSHEDKRLELHVRITEKPK